MNLPVLFLAAAAVLLPSTSNTSPAPATPAIVVKPGIARREHFISPILHVHPGPPQSPHVALTLDACTGHVDERILSTLIDNRIKATVFVTARWLKRNPQALSDMLSYPELFEIENHGAKHVAAIDHPALLFTVKAAGSPDAIHNEILDGAKAVKLATGREPVWYRGAAAEYTATAIDEIKSMNFKLAGYSLSGDGGAGYSTRRAAAAVASAQNGDVIIAHLNQPTKPAGAGVVQGLLALKAKGTIFVRLDERHIAH
jgi:peptidoglycan/xylan/chitin deacetylase (PgdA/CDA1 family)